MEFLKLNTKSTIQGVHGKMAISDYCFILWFRKPHLVGEGGGVIKAKVFEGKSFVQSKIKLLWDGEV